jgi:hypothetical protein
MRARRADRRQKIRSAAGIDLLRIGKVRVRRSAGDSDFDYLARLDRLECDKGVWDLWPNVI